jgi:hypothetical protein
MRCDASLWAPTNPSKDVLDIADSLYQKDPRAQKWSSWRRTFQLAHFHGTNFCVVSSFRANLRDRFQEVFYRENTTLRVCPKVIASAELKYPELMSRVNVRLLDATALDTSLDFTGTGWSAGAGVTKVLFGHGVFFAYWRFRDAHLKFELIIIAFSKCFFRFKNNPRCLQI